MERIFIEATNHLPLVDFETDGKFKLEGRVIPEDVNKFFNPLIEFVSQLETEKVEFNINLEYFNTATSKKLLDLLKHLDANNKIGLVNVNWHYEEGDDDSLEMGEVYEECMLRTSFRFIEYAEIQIKQNNI
ncbi:MAG: SiaC family regulatory phosphoprotein [Bacteroidales bacterium]|nr:SiaC family regulatory phosphoprotein [Bacteroidales bacterium]MBN2817383.1 SiaC family regulatory phosphoprotein [Bacteroidales bacterium]